MLCERCQQRPASGVVSVAWVTDEGIRGEGQEQLCSRCFDAYVAESTRRTAEVRAVTERSARDGTLFDGLRQELALLGPVPKPEELAHVASFLDQVASAVPVPLPDDLQAFADRHRRDR